MTCAAVRSPSPKGSGRKPRTVGGQGSGEKNEGVVLGRLGKPGGVSRDTTAACAASGTGGVAVSSRVSILLVGAAAFLAACSSSTAGNAVDSGGSIAKTKAEVIAAWRAAENAFYIAESEANGESSPMLSATMVNPQLQLVQRNLRLDHSQGLIGRGTWNLGSPLVVSLEPSAHPATATVRSCIDDTAILINEKTGQPVAGVAGTPDWVSETSSMVLTDSGWKLRNQEAVGNSSGRVACANVG